MRRGWGSQLDERPGDQYIINRLPARTAFSSANARTSAWCRQESCLPIGSRTGPPGEQLTTARISIFRRGVA